MAGEVAHHFPCPECGYDLYATPLDGNCPECGKPVPKRKGLDTPKNPRRVNSYYRSRIRRVQRGLWWMIPLTVLVVVAAGGSFWFRYPGWLKWLTRIWAFFSAMSLLEAWWDLEHSRKRIVPEEPRSSPDHPRE